MDQLPALASGDPSAWDQALYAFLVEKGDRSGSERTVESYSRMLWPFLRDLGKTSERVKAGQRSTSRSDGYGRSWRRAGSLLRELVIQVAARSCQAPTSKVLTGACSVPTAQVLDAACWTPAAG